ncbi:HNH endonuclease [Nocardioides guangzhouensis]|uniref:HNH endonuclease n=1 Tax=Nocardioides guangzhouensis TaxID=2497878 RepID=A0A4Q4ZD12_9ACTN|nr:DUF1524 domain-containing protein [Nocardioides guangzhouensis]RYP85505.1 HNH endonuclease [Nocardioides guangzhouensis]
MLRRTLSALSLAVAAPLALVAGTSAPAAAAPCSAPLTTAIADLTVAAEVRTGYSRDLLPHWVDADVDIDHMVPLAEAWDSGARSWTTATRRAYANDLGDYRTLVSVTDNVNQADSAEKSAVQSLAATCTSSTISVTLAS